MKLIFRWFGESDSVPLKFIRQIPMMSGVATALYDVPVGEVWSDDSIARAKKLCSDNGLEFEVVESVPVHEDIKTGDGRRDYYIDNYIKILKKLSKAGVKCVCYNFMPVFDWLRSDLRKLNSDGSYSAVYNQAFFDSGTPETLSLPGWADVYDPQLIKRMMSRYDGFTHEKLFSNLVYFLKAVTPECEKAGINMAIHPDDPPWDVYGLKRVVTNEYWLDKLFTAVPSRTNGLTFCTGSLGASKSNDLISLAKKFASRTHFAHIRNIAFCGESSFAETAHPSACGSLDICNIVKSLVKGGFDGYVRPDHGRDIWGENGRPSYGLYDRALGASYLYGLFEAFKC